MRCVITWLRTLWHGDPPEADNRQSQSAPPPPRCVPEWAIGLPSTFNAQLLATAFAAWTRQKPNFVGHALTGSSIIASFKAAWVPGPLRAFLCELAKQMPRQRLYKRGQPTQTVYHVRGGEGCVALPTRARKVA